EIKLNFHAEDADPPFTLKIKSPSGSVIVDRVIRELPTGLPQSAPPVTFTPSSAGEYKIEIKQLSGKQQGTAVLRAVDGPARRRRPRRRGRAHAPVGGQRQRPAVDLDRVHEAPPHGRVLDELRAPEDPRPRRADGRVGSILAPERAERLGVDQPQ